MGAKESIEKWLKEFEEFLSSQIPDEPKEMFLGVREYIFRGGKRFRPLLLFSSSTAIFPSWEEKAKQKLFLYASIIELFHNFTLIHDDIEDSSKLRRGKPTLHESYGVPLALNIGDALYTYIWKKVLDVEKSVQYALAEAFYRVVEGQAYEIYWIANNIFSLKEEDYFKMVKGKTAALIACSMQIPAVIEEVNSKEYEKVLYDAGISIGLAFQLIDDYLNLFGDEKKYGKKIGDDITEGKRSLLVIKALQELKEKDREKLISILSSHREDEQGIREAIDLISSTSAPDYVKELAESFYQRFLERVETLPYDKGPLLYLGKKAYKREK